MPSALALRDGLSGIAQIARRELQAHLVSVDPSVIKSAVADLAPGLIATYGAAAGAYAADWYDDLRAELEVRGSFTAKPASVGPAGVEALAGWGVAPLFGADPDLSAAVSLITGGLQRRIVNVGRETITQAATTDPQAKGWQRVGAGECDFCAVLIGRGAVYSEATADFETHDHCRCAAVPAF